MSQLRATKPFPGLGPRTKPGKLPFMGQPLDRTAFATVALLVGGMGGVVLIGILTLFWIDPGFFKTTRDGLAGEGAARLGVFLFVVQIVAFLLVGSGLLIWTWRKRP